MNGRLLLSILSWWYGKHSWKWQIIFILCCNFIACICSNAGSKTPTCDGNLTCICNTGYEGDKCSICTTGFYKTYNDFQHVCSGISASVVLIYEILLQLTQSFGDYGVFELNIVKWSWKILKAIRDDTNFEKLTRLNTLRLHI